MKSVRQLTIREKQAYAAVCFSFFCSSNGIEHPDLRAFVDHMLSMLITPDITVWEGEIWELSLWGENDEISQDVLSVVPLQFKNILGEIIEYVIEVGMCDMYGANSTNPHYFLKLCMSIFKKNGVEIPTPGELHLNTRFRWFINCKWGDAKSEEEYEQVRSAIAQMTN